MRGRPATSLHFTFIRMLWSLGCMTPLDPLLIIWVNTSGPVLIWSQTALIGTQLYDDSPVESDLSTVHIVREIRAIIHTKSDAGNALMMFR